MFIDLLPFSSQHCSVGGKVLHRLGEALLHQNVEVTVNIYRRVLQGAALLLGSRYNSGLIEIEQVVNELIGVLHLDAIRCQQVFREVSLIEGDDDTGTASNGCCRFTLIVSPMAP